MKANGFVGHSRGYDIFRTDRICWRRCRLGPFIYRWLFNLSMTIWRTLISPFICLCIFVKIKLPEQCCKLRDFVLLLLDTGRQNFNAILCIMLTAVGFRWVIKSRLCVLCGFNECLSPVCALCGFFLSMFLML